MKCTPHRIFWPTFSLALALTASSFAQETVKPSQALTAAIRKGDLAAVKAIVEANAPANGTPAADATTSSILNSRAGGNTPLYDAVQSGKAEIVTYLLEKGADPNQDTYSQRPLSTALTNSREWKAIADALVAKGADVNYTDNEGQTLLMRVLNYGGDAQKDKLAWLIANKADINSRNRYGKSALDLAVENSTPEIVTLLISVTDVKKTDENGNTPLFTAVANGKADYVKLLLDKGADIDAQNVVGDTVLHLAATRPGALLVTLLNAGARTDLKNHRGDLPVHVALRWPDEYSTVRQDSRTNFSRRRFATSESDVGTPRGTLAAPLTDKSDINARDQFGLTPLLITLQSRDQESRDLIMARAPKMDATTKLYDAVSQGDLVQVKALLTQKPFLVYFRLPDGTTPLHMSALWGTLGVAQLLVQKGADVNARDSDGETPLSKALTRPTSLFARRSKNMVAFLLEKGANAGPLDVNDSTPLHRAVKAGDLELVNALLAKKVNVNERDRSGQTPIFALMTRTSDSKLVKTLLDQGATVSIRDIQGASLLASAVQTRRKELVSLLLDKGADVNTKDTEGRTVLGTLIYSGASDETADIVSLLLDKGANPNERIYGDTLISRAISSDSKAVLRVLLATKKIDLKGSTERQSPLFQAINYGRNEMVGMLIDAGADPNEKNSEGKTAVEVATNRSKEMGDLVRAKMTKAAP